MRILLSLLCLSLSLTGIAQHRLTGTVMDGAEKSPIWYATVVLLTPDSTLLKGATSDESGRFELEQVDPGDYLVEVAYLGYEKIYRAVRIPNDSELGEISLLPSTNEMEAVVVRGNMIRRRADGYIFNPAGSGLTQGRNSLQLISFAPGVWSTPDGAISINGKGGTRVMVNDRLLDLSTEELKAYLENINAEQIQSIEVIPMAGSQYDASSGGGILKITLKRNTVSGLTGSVGITASTTERKESSPHHVSPSFNLDYRNGKWSLYGSFSYNWDKHLYTGENRTTYLSDSGREIFHKSKNTALPDYYNSRLGAVYEISDRHRVGFDVSLHRMNVDTRNTVDGTTTVGGVTSDLSSSLVTNRLTSNRNYSFNYRWQTDDKGSNLMIFADYIYNDREKHDHNYSEEVAPGGGTTSSDRMMDILATGEVYTLRADYKQILSEKFQLEGGFKFATTEMETDVHNQRMEDGAWTPAVELDDYYIYRESVLAGYVNATAKWGRWNAVAGLRAENTALNPYSRTRPNETREQNYTDIFPTAHLQYAINPQEGHMITAAYSRKIRRPGFDNLNPFRTQLDNYTWNMGNPNLRPYYINSISLTGIVKNQYSLTLGMEYENDVAMTVTEQDPDNPDILLSQPMNVNHVVNYYAVLSIPLRLNNWVRLNADLMGDYAVNKMSDYDMNGARLQGRFTSIFTLPKNWGADATYLFTTGNHIGNTLSDPLHTLSANVRKSFFDNRLTVNLFVNNILDFSVWNHVQTVEQPGVFRKVERTHTSSWGRTYGLTLRWNFRAGKEVRVQKVTYGNTEERAR